jgi:hypothetical protein
MSKRVIAIVVLLTYASTAGAKPHLASAPVHIDALSAEARRSDIAELTAFLHTPAAQKAAQRLHIDARLLEARLDAAEPHQLHELAQRTRHVHVIAVAAGVVLLLIVALALAVVVACGAGCGDPG